MVKAIYIAAIILAGLIVAIADSSTKEIATKDFWSSLKNPFIIGIMVLYFLQCCLFLYVFSKKVELGITANLQIGFYAIATVLIGWFFFGEKLKWKEILGIGISFVGIVLMSSG